MKLANLQKSKCNAACKLERVRAMTLKICSNDCNALLISKKQLQWAQPVTSVAAMLRLYSAANSKKLQMHSKCPTSDGPWTFSHDSLHKGQTQYAIAMMLTNSQKEPMTNIPQITEAITMISASCKCNCNVAPLMSNELHEIVNAITALCLEQATNSGSHDDFVTSKRNVLSWTTMQIMKSNCDKPYTSCTAMIMVNRYDGDQPESKVNQPGWKMSSQALKWTPQSTCCDLPIMRKRLLPCDAPMTQGKEICWMSQKVCSHLADYLQWLIVELDINSTINP